MGRLKVLGLVVALAVIASCGPSSETTTTTGAGEGTTSAEEETSTTGEPASSTSTSGPVTIDFSVFAPPEMSLCLFLSNVIFVESGSAQEVADFLMENAGIEAMPGAYDIEGNSIPSGLEGLLDLVTLPDGAPNAVLVTEYLRSEEFQAAPVHAVGMANHWQFSPGDDPVPYDYRFGDPGEPDPEQPFIGVVDTGLVTNTGMEWITEGVVYDAGVDDQELHNLGSSHGTFIVSVLRQMTPQNPVTFAAALPVAIGRFSSWPDEAFDPDSILPTNLTTEWDVIGGIRRLIARHGSFQYSTPDVMRALNLSWGTYPCESNNPSRDTNALQLALGEWFDAFPDSAVFAAAGNEPDVHGPFLPAGLSGISGLGGLVSVAAEGNKFPEIVWDDGAVADGSGRSWVDIRAPGCDILGASENQGSPVVAWSGSSFATTVAAANYANSTLPRGQADQVNITNFVNADTSRC